jgi:hypothetical protein
MKGALDTTTVQATVGFAADAHGTGIAYVRLRVRQTESVVRIPFTVTRYPALLEREVGYAALTAVAGALRSRGISRVNFLLDDASLTRDLREHCDVPSAIAMAYVRLRCTLNQFYDYEVACLGEGESDLTARARSEVAMHVAA